MAIERCFVCEKEYDTKMVSMVLIDGGVINRMTLCDDSVLNLCPECQRMVFVNYVVLVQRNLKITPKGLRLKEEDTNDQI